MVPGSSARGLVAAIARRELSAVEALDACLAAIAEHDGALGAVVSVDAERARVAAEEADVALGRGEPVGRLHGVPMTLKDGHDVAGLRTTVGTAALDRTADEDGTVAERLRAAGAILVGHTNVPPWLADYQSANPIFGRTANPWDLDRTAGGSSGGAAAAVAAGLTPLEIGSDLAGSLRLPAAFCGVYGLKTTEHRVPLTGFLRRPPSVPRSIRIAGSLGPIARDLDDLALGLEIVAGPDLHDPEVPPVPLGPPSACRLDELRLAVSPVLPGVTIARNVSDAVARLAMSLSDGGCAVCEALPALAWDDQFGLFEDLIRVITGIFSPEADVPGEHRTLAWYLGALDRRDRVISGWEVFFEQVDALILPATMTTAFAHRESGGTVEVDGKAVSYFAHGGPLVPLNLAGMPSLAVPAGRADDGLPIGVQIVGPRWSEMRLIGIGRELERAGVLPGFHPPPDY